MPPKGWKKKALSEEALKRMEDVAGFVDENGKPISLASHSFVSGPVTFDGAEKMGESDFAEVQFLTHADQFKSLRKWWLIEIRDLYRRAADQGKEDAYICCRVAKFLEDFLIAVESLEMKPEGVMQKDAFDDENPTSVLSTSDLPLAPEA